MHTKIFSWLSLLVAVVSLLAAEAAAQGTVVGAAPAVLQAGRAGKIMAKNVTGPVTFNAKGSTLAPTALVNDQEIGEGNIVHTGPGGSVVLLFENGASIRLADTSDLDIAEFKLDPIPANYDRKSATEEPSLSNTDITLTRGELIGNVKTLKKTPGNNSKFKVSTPVGAAGIRGTTFRIVYRPSGDGRTYNFTMTTVEGNVEVVVGTGTVTAPPVSVTNNKEVVLNNVEVNVTNNQVVAVLPTGASTAVNTATVGDAPVSTVTQVTAVATQLVQQIANVVFTPPASSTTPPADTTPKDTPKDTKKDTTTPGSTTTSPTLTPGT